MPQLVDYFENIISKIWIGEQSCQTHMDISEVEDIYLEQKIDNFHMIIGKTKEFYFILECHNSQGFIYSNALIQENLQKLINSYKKKEYFLNGCEVGDFVDNLFLKLKLESQLSIKETISEKKFKL